MGRLDDLSAGLQRFADDPGAVLRDVMRSDPLVERDMVALQRKQLFAGLASSGDHIRPTMDEDPYFGGNRAAWFSYASNKRKRFSREEGDARRPMNVPNLIFSTGLFHSGFYVDFRTDEVQMKNDTLVPDSHGVMHDVYAKYGAETFGLTDENWESVLAHVVPKMNDAILEML